ncbi:hypothetical protein SNOG_06892 [Parastagonospora nodorum SN15]|uniref:Uncharacterized protein n=1 Tax=Phaeosphaeria nodorum (strain SN15 / ATCC MYA-4574 / FGSC 10173) TaxID=321614 RepID=Q0UMX2_PHANO|nr:hypothetical protein SNOG_06892 [Parastagonospora nodorum SN15]EAT85543.1 hypothetical protein SNOG_06892 [Parastagonospora nodorum SN15]
MSSSYPRSSCQRAKLRAMHESPYRRRLPPLSHSLARHCAIQILESR